MLFFPSTCVLFPLGLLTLGRFRVRAPLGFPRSFPVLQRVCVLTDTHSLVNFLRRQAAVSGRDKGLLETFFILHISTWSAAEKCTVFPSSHPERGLWGVISGVAVQLSPSCGLNRVPQIHMLKPQPPVRLYLEMALIRR